LPLSHSLGAATADEPFDSLEILCRQADNAMFIDRNRRAPMRGRNLVRALMTALRKKDFGAEGHVSRVKVISTTLGEAVGLSPKDMVDLELLSEIHDLGKIGVPDRVLFKAGPLDHDEREQIKQHSALGYRIAKISPELEQVAELILYHQEWWNGAGYPTGIGGEEIPMPCRVLAIADAYDAMTSPRPHRLALSHNEAVAELRRGAGRQFDPAILEKFLQITEGS
jgi:HD-GYP domain-containing protein (c-di-GMP phosphodiesterase class II)